MGSRGVSQRSFQEEREVKIVVINNNTVICLFTILTFALRKAMKVKVAQSHLTLCDPMAQSMDFSRPEYWSG